VKVLAQIVLGAALTLAAFAEAPQAPAKPLAQVNAALQAGEADKALQLLGSAVLTEADLGEAHSLKCRVYFTLEQWDGAASECEQAVQSGKQNSSYHLWLGRALGEKANRASFLTAYSLSKRVRAEFEEAVRLNPRSAEALADLAEFYEQAPGVVGGGMDKADAIAAQMDKADATRGHELRGHIAEERKDIIGAEREYRQAIAASAHPAFQWVTLASFLSRRARWAEMEAAEHSVLTAATRDRRAAVALYDGASILTRVKRDPALAERMIQDYLASSFKTEEAPAFVAHTRLARLMKQQGDTEGASRERAAALALAQQYKPALDLNIQETKH
jgi:tetratricopeptide (TPR) repeat protein